MVNGTKLGRPELLLACTVLPNSPTLTRSPLGSGSLLKAEWTCGGGVPMSISREVVASLVTNAPTAGSYRPYWLLRWKSSAAASAKSAS